MRKITFFPTVVPEEKRKNSIRVSFFLATSPYWSGIGSEERTVGSPHLPAGEAGVVEASSFPDSADLGITGISQRTNYATTQPRIDHDHLPNHRGAEPDVRRAHLPAEHLPTADVPVLAVLRCKYEAAYASPVDQDWPQVACGWVAR